MAWPITKVNQAMTGASSWPSLLFLMIEDMIATGWRVLGSGDGLAAFENTGQTGGGSGVGTGGGYHVINQAGAGANGMSNQTFNVGSSWIRLASPLGAAVYREYLWVLDFRSGILLDDWRLLTTLDNPGFNSGGSAQTAPVAASSHFALAGNQVLAGTSTDFRAWRPSTVPSTMHWILGDVNEEFSFIMITTRGGANAVFSCWGLDQIVNAQPGSNPPTTDDPDPHIHIVGHTTAGGNSQDCFAFRGRMYDSLFNNTQGRFEDVTGSHNGGIFASSFLGEAQPSSPIGGHYQYAFSMYEEGATDFSFGSLGALPFVGKFGERPNNFIMRSEPIPRTYKGFTRGRLLRQATRVPGSPEVWEDDTGQRRLNIQGITIPWHPTEGFSA